jgi:hypothetical protein
MARLAKEQCQLELQLAQHRCEDGERALSKEVHSLRVAIDECGTTNSHSSSSSDGIGKGKGKSKGGEREEQPCHLSECLSLRALAVALSWVSSQVERAAAASELLAARCLAIFLTHIYPPLASILVGGAGYLASAAHFLYFEFLRPLYLKQIEPAARYTLNEQLLPFCRTTLLPLYRSNAQTHVESALALVKDFYWLYGHPIVEDYLEPIWNLIYGNFHYLLYFSAKYLDVEDEWTNFLFNLLQSSVDKI